MAVPKPTSPDLVAVEYPLLPETELSREERLALLRQHPGVIVRRREPRAAGPFRPSVHVADGSMTLEDMLRLLGRDDEEQAELADSEVAAAAAERS